MIISAKGCSRFILGLMVACSIANFLASNWPITSSPKESYIDLFTDPIVISGCMEACLE
jgi:hypothetical protein